jgi:hypothetical protein
MARLIYLTSLENKKSKEESEILTSMDVSLSSRGSMEATCTYFRITKHIIYVPGSVCDDLFIVCGSYTTYDSQDRRYAIAAMNEMYRDMDLINPVSYYKLCVHLSDSYPEMRDWAYKTLLKCTSSKYECILLESVQILKNTLYHEINDSREYATIILGEISKYNPILITENVYKTLTYYLHDDNESVSRVTKITIRNIRQHCLHLAPLINDIVIDNEEINNTSTREMRSTAMTDTIKIEETENKKKTRKVVKFKHKNLNQIKLSVIKESLNELSSNEEIESVSEESDSNDSDTSSEINSSNNSNNDESESEDGDSVEEKKKCFDKVVPSKEDNVSLGDESCSSSSSTSSSGSSDSESIREEKKKLVMVSDSSYDASCIPVVKHVTNSSSSDSGDDDSEAESNDSGSN